MAVWMGGCDYIFHLEHVEAVAGTVADGSLDMATVDCRDPSQLSHDEDVDSIVDGCDNCPALANVGQDDMDRDGVGDACDPRADVVGDSIALFDPFTTALPGWVMHGGTWLLGNDVALQGTATAIPGDLRYETMMFTNPTIDMVIEGGSPGGNVAAVGIYARTDTPSAGGIVDGIVCQVLFQNAAVTLDVVTVSGGTGMGHIMTGLVPYQPVRLRADQRGNCSAFRPSFAQVHVELSPAATPAPSQIMLHTDTATATVRSVTVYVHP